MNSCYLIVFKIMFIYKNAIDEATRLCDYDIVELLFKESVEVSKEGTERANEIPADYESLILKNRQQEAQIKQLEKEVSHLKDESARFKEKELYFENEFNQLKAEICRLKEDKNTT